MDDTQLKALRQLASVFRDAIEQARAERAPGALPYFPEGACRMTSRLFAQYLTRRPGGSVFGRASLASGVLPEGELPTRHYWLELGDVVVDLTADPFGEPRVIVGSPTAFHRSLSQCTSDDAGEARGALSSDETARLVRQLAAIEARLPSSALQLSHALWSDQTNSVDTLLSHHRAEASDGESS